MKLIFEMPMEDIDNIVDAMMSIIMAEIEAGLGLSDDLDDIDDDDDELVFFDLIDRIYDRANGDCYFCNRNQEINEQFDPDVHSLCINCQAKLGNFLVFAGLRKPERLLPFAMNSEKVQGVRLAAKE